MKITTYENGKQRSVAPRALPFILGIMGLVGVFTFGSVPGLAQDQAPGPGEHDFDLNSALQEGIAAGDGQDGPSASELAPDAEAGAGDDQPATPPDPAEAAQKDGPRMPGPALKLSPQYSDHIPPGETAADDAATNDATDADPASVRRVLADRLNLRSGPGTGHGVIGSVTRDQEVTPIAEPDEGWVHVRLADGREGWLADEYLSSP